MGKYYYNDDTDSDETDLSSYCQRCSRNFGSEAAFNQHAANSLRHYYCRPCGRDFVSCEARRQHWSASVMHTYTYCDRCERNFGSRDLRLEHKRATPAQHFLCEPCNIDFATPGAQIEHFATSSTHVDTYCLKCETNFDNASNLREHSKTHLPRNMQCWGCGGSKIFATFSAMILHLETGTCAGSWTIKHINALAAEAPNADQIILKDYVPWLRAGPPPPAVKANGNELGLDRWICPTCSRCYHRQAHLHLRNQECCQGFPNILKCPICPDRFTTLSGLFQHIETPRCRATRSTASIAELMKTLRMNLATPAIQEELNKVQYKLVPDPRRIGKLTVTVTDTSVDS